MPTELPPTSRAARVIAVGALFLALSPRSDTPAAALETTHTVLVPHGEVEFSRLRDIGVRADADVALVDDFLGVGGAALAGIRVHVYPTLESKGLDTGYTLPTHAFPVTGDAIAADVHVSLEEGFEGDLSVELATVVLRQRLGRPRTDALEAGLATLAVGSWRGRAPLYWASRLALLEDVQSPGGLLDSRVFRRRSKLVTRPLAAALASFLIRKWGKPSFLDRYSEWVPTPDEIAALEPAWRAYLRGLRDRRGVETGERPSLPVFQRGFCLAHEGYQIHNGYLSRKSDLALERLSALGTNAVSITPFTYMRSPHRPAPFPFSSGAGSENDESVIHAALRAKRLGMSVMLKPHVWLSGGWPGEVEMKSEEDWEAFFGHYRRWMTHYALLAEMYAVDVLCVGVELSKTTVSQPRRWQELIRSLRSVYRGRMTYAANWGEEFESIAIWPDLDYIGMNCYYPLSDSPDPSDADLARGIDDALARLDDAGARFGKPVIITEVGFASMEAPWLAPYERRRDAPVDTAAQARCYELFFRGLAGRKHCAGVYWWKWPSFLEYGGPRHPGFTPNGKPAEEVVRRWYGEILRD